jgi:hypothetical protein
LDDIRSSSPEESSLASRLEVLKLVVKGIDSILSRALAMVLQGRHSEDKAREKSEESGMQSG